MAKKTRAFYSEAMDEYILSEPSNWKAAILLDRTPAAIEAHFVKLRKEGRMGVDRNHLRKEAARIELESDLLFEKIPQELADAYNSRTNSKKRGRPTLEEVAARTKSQASTNEDDNDRINNPEQSSFFQQNAQEKEHDAFIEPSLLTSVNASASSTHPPTPPTQINADELQQQLQHIFLTVGNVNIKLKQGIPFSMNGNVVEIG